MAAISGPGKFSDTLDAYLWVVSMHGGPDEETGDNSMGPRGTALCADR